MRVGRFAAATKHWLKTIFGWPGHRREALVVRSIPRLDWGRTSFNPSHPSSLLIVTNIPVRPIRRWRALLAAAGRVFLDPEKHFMQKTLVTVATLAMVGISL